MYGKNTLYTIYTSSHGTKVDGIPTPQHQGANTVIKKL